MPQVLRNCFIDFLYLSFFHSECSAPNKQIPIFLKNAFPVRKLAIITAQYIASFFFNIKHLHSFYTIRQLSAKCSGIAADSPALIFHFDNYSAKTIIAYQDVASAGKYRVINLFFPNPLKNLRQFFLGADFHKILGLAADSKSSHRRQRNIFLYFRLYHRYIVKKEKGLNSFQ